MNTHSLDCILAKQIFITNVQTEHLEEISTTNVQDEHLKINIYPKCAIQTPILQYEHLVS